MDKSKQKKKDDRNRSWQEKRKLIYVLPNTQKKLKLFGNIGDTFDDAISHLILFAEENREKYDDFIRSI